MGANTSPYFKCYPSDFLSGVLGLGPEEIAVYTVVLMMVYDRGEPIREDADTLAWRCRMNVRRFKNVLDRLIELGKLTRLDGCLSNHRAEKEIISRREVSEKQASNAHARWAQPEKKTSKNNEPPMPPHSDGNAYQKLEAREDKNLTVLCPKVRTRKTYSEDFEGFWEGYPTDANMSKKAAGEAWARISSEDRQLAVESLPAFRAYCEAHPDYRPLHANRYLTQRRFEGHLKVARKSTQLVFHKVGSEGFRAWDAYLRRTSGKGAPHSEKHQGWSFESEFPPDYHHQEAAE